MISDATARRMLRDRIARTGSLRAWARDRGMAHSYISQVINGHRPLSDELLVYLGLERVVAYRRVTATPERNQS